MESVLDDLERRLQERPARLACAWRIAIRRGMSCPQHSHPMIELVYHRRGKGWSTTSGGCKIAFAPHSVVIYPPGLAHDQFNETAGEDICLHLEWRGLAKREIREPLAISPGDTDPFVRREFPALAQAGGAGGKRAALNLRASALLAWLVRRARPFGEEAESSVLAGRLRRAREFIRDNYARIDHVKQIADAAGVSEDYLRHLLAENGLESAGRLLTKARIERARELLIHSRLALKEIAVLCGFRTERYFCTLFRRATGLTAGTFRRTHGMARE